MDAFIKELVQDLEHVQISRYAQLSSSCIILFDHLITLDDEINLIWPSSWSLGKVLFLLNRYYSLAAVLFNNYGFFSPNLTHEFCLRFFQWQGWTGLIGCMLAEGILQMRLYALFSLDKRILFLMLSMFVASTGTAAWIMWNVVTKISALALPLPNNDIFCAPNGIPKDFYMFWVPLLVYECLLCTLALVRGFQTLRRSGSLFLNGRQLVVILVRDSIMYFLVICVTYMASLLIWIMAPSTLLEVPIGFTIAMSCVLANRVVLNVRDAGQDVSVTDSKRPITHASRYDTSFCSPGTITQFEMDQLRSMKADKQLEDIYEDYEYSTHKA
ncbi:hypothetical protein CPB83DRAFT_861427 [Crepidotus variabilis]|uniref:DUF6533 domain-containing protein n=1 Tax=Crepidotus variabilis TaxID=179855 RepID=A0A9P6JKX8_9AGAR|nr:hypothetical protein CPB83DRAFT_861427 [Crepidotus variabilis]